MLTHAPGAAVVRRRFTASRPWHIPFCRWVFNFLTLLVYVLLLTVLAFSDDPADKVRKLGEE